MVCSYQGFLASTHRPRTGCDLAFVAIMFPCGLRGDITLTKVVFNLFDGTGFPRIVAAAARRFDYDLISLSQEDAGELCRRNGTERFGETRERCLTFSLD